MEDYEIREKLEAIRAQGFEDGRQDIVEKSQARQKTAEPLLDIVEFALPGAADAYLDGYGHAHDSFTYLVCKGSTSGNYLGFGSGFVRTETYARIVRCYKEHYKWQEARLASGLELLSPNGGFNSVGHALDWLADYEKRSKAYAEG